MPKTTAQATDILPALIPQEKIEKEPATEPEKTVRKPARTISRRIEELKTVSPKSMSENEKIKYIEYLTEQLDLAQTQYLTLQKNTEGAFNQVRATEKVMQDLRTSMRAREAFVKQAVGTCYSSIILALEQTERSGNNGN